MTNSELYKEIAEALSEELNNSSDTINNVVSLEEYEKINLGQVRRQIEYFRAGGFGELPEVNACITKWAENNNVDISKLPTEEELEQISAALEDRQFPEE